MRRADDFFNIAQRKNRVKIELLSIGRELLLGMTVNTNASFIAQTVVQEGYRVHRVTTVDDNMGEIQLALKGALDRSDVVIITGGLGDTHDDLTVAAVKVLFTEEGEIL